MAARLAIEREVAAQLQLLKKGGLAATPSFLGTAAEQQQHPLDANLRLLATGGVEARLSPMPATEQRAVPSCQQFFDGLMPGNYDCDADKSVLEANANAILLRGERQEIRLRHKNGRVRIYTKQLMPRKSQVKTIQINKRRVAACRLNRSGGSGALMSQSGQTRLARGLVRLSVAEQVGLIAAPSTSHIGFNRWRKALGGSRGGLSSMATLRAHRRELASLPDK